MTAGERARSAQHLYAALHGFNETATRNENAASDERARIALHRDIIPAPRNRLRARTMTLRSVLTNIRRQLLDQAQRGADEPVLDWDGQQLQGNALEQRALEYVAALVATVDEYRSETSRLAQPEIRHQLEEMDRRLGELHQRIRTDEDRTGMNEALEILGAHVDALWEEAAAGRPRDRPGGG